MRKILSGLVLGAFVIGAGYGLVGFQTRPADATGTENENHNGNVNTNTSTDAGRVACVLAAVGPRETAILASWNTYSAAIKAAYEKRATDLTAAWSITDKKARKTAIKKAWTDFKSSRKMARKTFNNERSNTWKTFEKARKACNVQSEGFGSSDDGQPTHRD